MKPHTILFLLVTMSLVSSCNGSKRARSADLIFVVEQISESKNMSDAIIEATGTENISATHVGIIEVNEDGTYVIDASPRNGVSKRTQKEFVNEFVDSENSFCVIMRLKKMINADSVLSKACQYIGLPYDYCFLPGNDSIYCSELVQLCYADSDGNPVFESKPMNFKADNGQYPEFWKSLFARRNIPIPQGVPGTNPTDMMNSGLLRQVAKIQ